MPTSTKQISSLLFHFSTQCTAANLASQASSIYSAKLRERQVLDAEYRRRRALKLARKKMFADNRQHIRIAAVTGQLPGLKSPEVPPGGTAAATASEAAAAETPVAEEDEPPTSSLPILVKADVQVNVGRASGVSCPHRLPCLERGPCV